MSGYGYWLNIEGGATELETAESLRRRFETDPDLAQQRDAGTEFGGWVDELERYDLGERRDALADLAAGVDFYSPGTGELIISDGDPRGTTAAHVPLSVLSGASLSHDHPRGPRELARAIGADRVPVPAEEAAARIAAAAEDWIIASDALADLALRAEENYGTRRGADMSKMWTVEYGDPEGGRARLSFGTPEAVAPRAVQEKALRAIGQLERAFGGHGGREAPVHAIRAEGPTGPSMSFDPPVPAGSLAEAMERRGLTGGHAVLMRAGDDALVARELPTRTEYVVAHGYDEATGTWGHGTYLTSLAEAAAMLEGRLIAPEGAIMMESWSERDAMDAAEAVGAEPSRSWASSEAPHEVDAERVRKAGQRALRDAARVALAQGVLERAGFEASPVRDPDGTVTLFDGDWFHAEDAGFDADETYEALIAADDARGEFLESLLYELDYLLERDHPGAAVMGAGTSSGWSWSGEGHTDLADSLPDLLSGEFAGGSLTDCEIDWIKDIDGELTVHGYHHDGSTVLRIRAIPPEAVRRLEGIEAEMAWNDAGEDLGRAQRGEWEAAGHLHAAAGLGMGGAARATRPEEKAAEQAAAHGHGRSR